MVGRHFDRNAVYSRLYQVRYCFCGYQQQCWWETRHHTSHAVLGSLRRVTRVKALFTRQSASQYGLRDTFISRLDPLKSTTASFNKPLFQDGLW